MEWLDQRVVPTGDRAHGRVTLVRSVLAVTVALVLAAGMASVVVAQDESPTASVEASASGAPATDLAAFFPAELAGVPLAREDITVRPVAELTEGSPDIERQYQAVVDATGVPIEEMSQATAFVQTEDGELLNLAVLHVPGADAAVVRDVVVPVALAAWDGGMAEETELAGLTVTVIHGDSPDVDAIYIYPAGDLLWIVSGLEEVVATTLADISG